MKRLLMLATMLMLGEMIGPLLVAQRTAFAPAGRDFPLVGGNLANQRYSALTYINRSNIGRLGGAWMIHLSEGEPRTLQAAPVVVNGVMYMGAAGDVLAINAATGAVIWRYTSTFGTQINRGVTVADGKVFTGQAGSRLIALDQTTGALLWETKVYDGARGGGTPGATLYSDGRVFAGVAGGEAGVRGQFGAYDAKTGKELWKFNLIPAPGEWGHDTWEGESWTRGGAPLWTHAAIDADLGLVYVPAGNAAPDQDGSDRGGDNLFTVSIVALDVKTGARRWHFQEVHHDLWDYDNPLPPVLADIQFQGRPRKILIHGGKTGLTYILDRTTGQPLIGIEERPVPQVPGNKTARTQPWPLGDSPVPNCPEPGSVASGAIESCVFGAFSATQPVVMTPGTQGGINWAPVTFSPSTNLFYVPGSLINSQFASGFGRPAGQPRAGTLTAMDPATNRVVWQVRTKFPLATGSGLLSTASGLLFNGQSDGHLVAYDIRDGRELWRFQTGAGADAPVVTYEVNGEQYVAILAAGNSFQLSATGDHLWAFKLGGTLPPAPAPEAPPTIQPGGGRRGAPPAEGAAPAAARGRVTGVGARGVPAPVSAAPSVPAIVFSVTNSTNEGPGSLRQAILDNNGTVAGPKVIEFDFPPGAAPTVIAPTGQFLPPLKGPVTVRVKGAPVLVRGVTPTPTIVLDGSNLGARTAADCQGAGGRDNLDAGLAIHDSEKVDISGLEIRRFCIGVAAVRSHHVYLHDLKIVDSLGVAGVLFTGDEGTSTTMTSSHDNMLLNSWLLDNRNGVTVSRGTRDSIVQGSTIAHTRSSPAGAHAVEFVASGSSNAVMGNTFTGFSDTAVVVSGANQTIRDNSFTANAGIGLEATGPNLLILGNRFIDNTGRAMSVSGRGTRVVDNVIAGNTAGGIVLRGSGVTLTRNAVFNNGRAAVDVAPAMSSMFPPAPAIAATSRWTADELVLDGTLSAKPGSRYQVQIFMSRRADRHTGSEHGGGEGEKYIGTALARTDSGGKATFSLTVRVPDIFGDGQSTGFVTATATDAAGSTSRYGKALPLSQIKR